MKESKWKLIMKPKNIPFGITFLIALAVTILGFMGIVGVNWINSAILLVLISIAYQLLSSHIVMDKLKDRLDYPLVTKILKSYDELKDEIRIRLKDADEIWLLTRTGTGWFRDKAFGKEIRKVIKKGKDSRLLFLNPKPDEGALKMHADSSKLEWYENKEVLETKFEQIRANCFKLNNELMKENTKRKKKLFQLKVIDHLPAWTFFIINPNRRNSDSVIYAESGSYRSASDERPFLKITVQDIKYFNEFIEEFEEMWNDGEEWEIRDNN